MRTDDVLRDDDPVAIAAAVRTLAGDVHRALDRAAAGSLCRPDEAFVALQRRAVVLQDRLGDARFHGGIRRWLQALQQRIFIVQWLGESLEDRLGIGGRGRTRLPA